MPARPPLYAPGLLVTATITTRARAHAHGRATVVQLTGRVHERVSEEYYRGVGSAQTEPDAQRSRRGVVCTSAAAQLTACCSAVQG
jgi:hypothetical protein